MTAGSGDSGKDIKTKFNESYTLNATPKANLPANLRALSDLASWVGKTPYHLYVAIHKSNDESIIFVGFSPRDKSA